MTLRQGRQELELIPRDVLFGHPERAGPAVSPDATRIAYLAPSNGALSAWVRTLGTNDDRVVASDPNRPIRNAFWSPDGSRVLYLQDARGDENFHLFAAAPEGDGAPVDLTPYEGTRAGVQAIDPAHPDAILVLMNRRDPRAFDVYRLDPRSGETVVDTENPGTYAGFGEDVELRVRAAVAQRPDASAELAVRDAPSAPWRTLATFAAEDGLPQPVGFTTDGAGVYVLTSADANAVRLVRYDVAGGAREEIEGDPTFDLARVIFSPRSKLPIAASVIRERSDWIVLDHEYEADFRALAEQIPGDTSVESIDRDDTCWVVLSNVDAGSPSYWLYDRRSRRAEKLFATRPALERYRLASTTPIRYPARDGVEVHAYLTTPPGVEPKGLPTVLLVHGGPWARDTWGYNGTVQWLANRGYAVLQPNFRGSTGYGKHFTNAGDREWAGAMRTDLLDAKAWLVQHGIADPMRVAIMGGSYGGYAVLTALAFEPLAFACGVDIVGPSNLNTLLASIPPYWEPTRATLARRMGDDPAFLSTQSPLFRAGEIRAPLLIGQGANDPRVKIAESDQIVHAMRERELPVTYVVFDDEGHGWAHPQNAKRFNATVERFLADNLGGRVEPPHPGEEIEPFLH